MNRNYIEFHALSRSTPEQQRQLEAVLAHPRIPGWMKPAPQRHHVSTQRRGVVSKLLNFFGGRS